jgi:Cu(I)/Ag(I) efflux system membrane fusion protein
MGLGIVSMVSVWVGCSSATNPPSAESVQTSSAHEGHDHGHGQGHGGGTVQSKNAKEIEEALAKLSEEDRNLAIAQKLCPVSDEPLGSMGAPIKLNVNGRDVFICCDGCGDFLKEEPEKYLAKLPKSGE